MKPKTFILRDMIIKLVKKVRYMPVKLSNLQEKAEQPRLAQISDLQLTQIHDMLEKKGNSPGTCWTTTSKKLTHLRSQAPSNRCSIQNLFIAYSHNFTVITTSSNQTLRLACMSLDGSRH